MKKILVILGPTATGKTDVALQLAGKFQGELVACDSRQVYQGLDIGTGKEPGKSIMGHVLRVNKGQGFWEMGGIRVWMYDVVDLKSQFTVKDYVDQSEQVVEDILGRGKLPIIVGGTGLYLKGLLRGFPNLSIPVDEKLRGRLENLSLPELQKKLIALSPIRFNEFSDSDKKNPRRLLRSIELSTMNPYNSTVHSSQFTVHSWDVLKIGLTAPRQVLNEKINSRVFDWIDQGIIEETEALIERGINPERFKGLGLEYALVMKYLQGEMGKEELVDKMQTVVRKYAKRQITWFKKEPDINWFDVIGKIWQEKMEKVVDIWYHAGT